MADSHTTSVHPWQSFDLEKLLSSGRCLLIGTYSLNMLSSLPLQSFDLEKILSMDPAFLTVSAWLARGWSVHGLSSLGCQMCWLT